MTSISYENLNVFRSSAKNRLPMQHIYEDDWTVNANPIEAATIEIGDSVKISNGRERFFALVRVCEEDGSIVGVVSNRLLIDSPYNLGDLVSFRKNNVLFRRTAAERDRVVDALAQAYVNAYQAVHNKMPSLEESLEYWERTCNSKSPRAK